MYSEAAHHSIVFGEAWEQTFDDIVRDARLMQDPSLLVTRPTASDSSLAPAGHDLFYVLAPAPNLTHSNIDCSSIAEEYAQYVVNLVQDRLLPGLRDGAHVLRAVTPADWARQGMVAGTPFALSHTFFQTGPFRPANIVRGVDNAVLAGSSTVPGVGVPTALISGRLAADRITGTVGRSTRRVITKAALR
jgi:phytoene desaturase